MKSHAENGWKLIAIAPQDKSTRTYDHLKKALEHTLEDVEVRITGNVRIV